MEENNKWPICIDVFSGFCCFHCFRCLFISFFICLVFLMFLSFNIFHLIIKLLLLSEIHPWKLSLNLKITKIIFQTFIFRFHVHFRGCKFGCRKEGAFSLLNVTFELTEKGLDAVEEIGSGKPVRGGKMWMWGCACLQASILGLDSEVLPYGQSTWHSPQTVG